MSKLHEIWPVQGKSRGTVIFVHGLGGHHDETWRHEDSNAFWPDWLGEDLQDVRVVSVDYPAAVTNWSGSSMPLQDRAGNVLETLMVSRADLDGPIIFVCHSLGGLVTKQLLRRAHDQANVHGEVREFLEKVRGVVFIATPHSGSSLASTLNAFQRILRVTSATRDLIKNDPTLRDLTIWHRNWSEHREDVRHRVFYETRPILGMMTVGLDSADPGLANTRVVGIDEDHISICKPRDREHLIYASTLDFIRTNLPTGNNLTDQKTEHDLIMLPIEGVNFVRLGAKKYENNEKFDFSFAANIVFEQSDVILLGFCADYISPDGCYCLNLSNKISIDGQSVETSGNYLTLKQPVHLTGRATRIDYYRQMRPPLPVQAPADCDYGDLRIRVTWLENNIEKTISKFFRFEVAGELIPIERHRDPPLLSDEVLNEMLAEGTITEAEFRRASSVSAVDRYQFIRFPDYKTQAFTRPDGAIWNISPEYRTFLNDLSVRFRNRA